MKKLILSLMMIFVSAGCSAQETSESTKNETKTITTEMGEVEIPTQHEAILVM